MFDPKLAIVIPAYKLTFFDKTLKSILSQTNKNFTLYIGDDNSPEDLYSVVKNYEAVLNIVYRRFEGNIGSISVVQHWNRCVAMTKLEEWIWLFSDDDIMSEDCVELFYQAIEKTSGGYDLYRFDCSIIDEAGNKIINKSRFPQIQTSFDFLISRLSYQYHSYIVNFIFSRYVYFEYNGFVNFNAAWGSDDATWILYGQKKGIFTLERGEVEWRVSPINISGNTNNLINRQQKYQGTEQFIEWMYDWVNQNKILIDDKLVIRWYLIMLRLIGFRKTFWVYIKSKSFRTFFWRKKSFYQLSLFLKDL